MSLEHERAAADATASDPVRCAVLTVSDTRTPETDRGGDTADRILRASGHLVVERGIVRDDAAEIRAAVEAWLRDHDIHAVITTGGTGISKRDTTVEIVRSLLDVELEGFGELFRMLSFNEVGAAAMMSRAVGGLVGCNGGTGASETLLFAIPGSVNAVQTAVERLIAPQLAHLVWERRR